MATIQQINDLRLRRNELRRRVGALLPDGATWDALDGPAQDERLSAAEEITGKLVEVESDLDRCVDELALVALGVRIAAAATFASAHVPLSGGTYASIYSLMPRHVLAQTVLRLKAEAAACQGTELAEEVERHLGLAIEAQTTPALAARGYAKRMEAAARARPVETVPDGVDLMTGGVSRNHLRVVSAAGDGGRGLVPYGHNGVGRQPFEEPGIALARFTKCWIGSRGNPQMADQLAKDWYGNDQRIDFRAAIAQNIGTAGGFLVPEQFSLEVALLLRERTVVRPNARGVPLAGTLVMPVQTGGVTAEWLGENTDVLASAPTYGQRRLTSRMLRALVPISNSLVRNSTPEADTLVRDEMVNALASAEDSALLRSPGLGNAPKGLRYWALAANINNGTGTTFTTIEADMVAMVSRFVDGLKGNLGSPRWLMPSRTYYHLYSLRDTNGNLVFPELRSAGDPRILGFPVSITNKIPTNLSPGTVTEIFLIDFQFVLLGTELGITVDVSTEASYRDAAGNLQSAFSMDQTVIRSITAMDLVTTQDEAVQVLTGSNISY